MATMAEGEVVERIALKTIYPVVNGGGVGVGGSGGGRGMAGSEGKWWCESKW